MTFKLGQIIRDGEWVAFNLPFGKQVFINDRNVGNENQCFITNVGVLCVSVLGVTKKSGTISLSNAAEN